MQAEPEDQRMYLHVDDVAMEAIADSMDGCIALLARQAEEMAMVFQRLALPLAWPKLALTGTSRMLLENCKRPLMKV